MKKETKKISLITCFVFLSLFIIHVINKIIFFFSTLKEILYRQNSSYYDWRFGKISYTKKGSGDAILLIHDLSSTGSNYEFKELENYLSKTNTVYTIDLIGCGRSDKPNLTYTNYLYVQLICDFIKDIIQTETTVITSRKSCAISVMACYIDSSLISNLILINPTSLKQLNKYPKRRHKLLKTLLDIPIIGTFIYNIKNSKYNINKKFSMDYLSNSYPVNRYESAFSEAAHTSGSNSKYVYTSIACHYTNTNIIHALKGIHTPIHIIAGSDVPQISNTIMEYQYYNPSIQSENIDHTKGMPHIEKPKECANAIAKFL